MDSHKPRPVDEDNSTNPLTSNDRAANQSWQVRLTDGRVPPPSCPALLAPTALYFANFVGVQGSSASEGGDGVAGRAHVRGACGTLIGKLGREKKASLAARTI